VLKEITHDTRATFKSMCYDDICCSNVDYMWGLLKSLTWYQWQCESANESFRCPSTSPYGIHTQSPCVDQRRDLPHHYPYYPHVMCSYCRSFDHDVTHCTCYDVSNESFVT